MSPKRSYPWHNAIAAFVLFSVLMGSVVSPIPVVASEGHQEDDLRIDVHRQTGKVNFIGADPDLAFHLPEAAMDGVAAEDLPIRYLEYFGDMLGLEVPARELQVMRQRAVDGGKRTSTRYQQVYQGVPILAGELIVNLDETGALLSISGEVSPDLDLSIEPVVTADAAREAALAAIAKGYGLSVADLEATQPELWIFDERLLRPSARPAELVWRMEVIAKGADPVEELVLVNAHTGGLSLHFNQIDTRWGGAGTAPAPQADGESLFLPYIVYPAADDADALGIGDFNNDGRNDVAMTVGIGVPADTYLYVYLQDSEGNLQSPASYPLGARPESLDLGDLNNDGRDDVVVGLFSANQIGVLLQNAGGTLDAMVTYPCSTGPDSVKVGDLNDDGRMDVVVSHWNAPNIGVFLQQVDGSLGTMVSYSSNQAGYDEIDVGDVNDDGRTDVVKLNGQGLNPNILVYLQADTGTLEEATPYDLEEDRLANGLAIGDVTGDGKEDVVLSYGGNLSTARIGVFAQNASGTLDPSVSYNAYDIPEPVEVADVNLDGRLDVVVAHSGWRRVSIYLQSETGTLQPYFLLPVEYDTFNPQGLAVGDITGDGWPDIVLTGNDELVVLEHYTPPPPGGFRSTYTANNGTSLPGTLLCEESSPNCTLGADPHADAAHVYGAHTYAFYHDQHGRESIDGAAMRIVSTVHYGVDYENAFWSNADQQMVYGDAYGYPLADDVVAHELTHGVTEYESNLFYYYQSGAISESFSDLWGEFVDLTNGAGNDDPGVRWLVGEDVAGMGAIRDMQEPPTYDDPDRMTSSNYYVDSADLDYFGDNGGVHTNSGVNNKAVYLMTDGGSFNGRTVSGLGIDKVAAIYYEVQTHILTSGSDYRDLYNATYQACLNLVGGPLGITDVDCDQVRKAADAVEMNKEPAVGYNPEISICPGNQVPTLYFNDNLEVGPGNWITGALSGANGWFYSSGYAYSGTNMLWGDDSYLGSDSYIAMASDVTLPAATTSYLHFKHAFGFEDPNWDGAWLEYSMDFGSTWLDAGSFIEAGLAYTGSISTDWDNPNPGHPAYVGDSHGYVSTRLNLAALEGENVRFRWRMSTDSLVYDLGWVVDDVRIYTCSLLPIAPADFDADAISDVVIFRSGAWRFFDYGTASFDHGVWTGTAPGCIPAPMDYDGDGGVEFTQLCDGAWHFYYDGGSYNKGIWTGGVPGDLPVPADYDGDGIDDVVVWRAGAWRFFDFDSGAFDHGVWTGSPPHWLGGTSMPVPMDYDGDGQAEFTVWAGGPWHFYNDDGTYNKGIWTGGVAGDLPVPADYNGDVTEEVVVWRAGAWRFFNLTTGVFVKGVWTGAPPHWLGGTPLPAPLDVDGDGVVDFTVFSGGPWHFYDASGSYVKGIWTGGVAGDMPISRRLQP